jgi:serine/threonine protein kinase
MALPPGTLLKGNRYQIQELLARGGFGFVYLTYDRLVGRRVVLKELIPALVGDKQMLRRFMREGRAIMRLSHPNIARTYGTFKDQGNYYMILEYVSGGALSDWTDRGRKLSLSRTARITLALCDALTYMHRKGVTHCDLNPSNVLFDAQNRPKLIDLGIAHVSDRLVHRHWQTQRDFPMGTIVYMAPEQLDGVRDDPRVDLYSLGVMTYQMVTGRHYLDFTLRDTPGAYADNVERVRHQMPKPMSDVPAAVERVIARTLAKSPGARYPDVSTFRYEFLQSVLPYLPVAEGMRLVASFRPIGERRSRELEAVEWPRWVWATLLALNMTAMVLVAVLLFGSP